MVEYYTLCTLCCRLPSTPLPVFPESAVCSPKDSGNDGRGVAPQVPAESSYFSLLKGRKDTKYFVSVCPATMIGSLWQRPELGLLSLCRLTRCSIVVCVVARGRPLLSLAFLPRRVTRHMCVWVCLRDKRTREFGSDLDLFVSLFSWHGCSVRLPGSDSRAKTSYGSPFIRIRATPGTVL